MAHWKNFGLFLVAFSVACDSGVVGPGLDDTSDERTDEDLIDITDEDATSDTDNVGGDGLLPGDSDGDAGGGDGAGGDGVGGGDDQPPTDDDPPPPTPVPTTFEAVSVVGQSALAGTPVGEVPEVEVRDQFDAPMAGIAVRFEVLAGGGTIVPTTNVTTDAQGRAKLTSWTLGKSAVPNAVRASLPDHEALGLERFDATVETSYQIEIVFLDPPTDEQRAAFESAAARWMAVIVNDLPNGVFTRDILPESCGGIPGDTTPIPVDDLFIYARVGAIDGVGGTLAQAGPCLGRSAGAGAPAVGVMSFDSADIVSLEQAGLFDETILHEMGHVIGIGTYWDTLIDNPSLPASPGADTVFTGAFAQDAYVSIDGADVPTPVPADNSAVAGSADAHWRESVFTNELMSPSLDFADTSLPLSLVTVASLSDLGFYDANAAAADFFSLAPTLRAPTPEGPRLENWCEVVRPTGVITTP